MKMLFATARTYAWLYQSTGNRAYLRTLRTVLVMIKDRKHDKNDQHIIADYSGNSTVIDFRSGS